MELKQVPLRLIDPWPRNPRGITDRGFERLKRQIRKHGEYKPLIVEPMPGGRYMALGGNMRLRAFQELKFKLVWVSIVRPKSAAEQTEYAMSDNDRVGSYLREALAKLVAKVKRDVVLEDYQITLGGEVSIPGLMKDYGPGMGILEKELDETIKTAHRCQECGYKW